MTANTYCNLVFGTDFILGTEKFYKFSCTILELEMFPKKILFEVPSGQLCDKTKKLYDTKTAF